MSYLDDIDPLNFTPEDYIASLDEKYESEPGSVVQMLRTTKGRRILTRNDPLLFALLYFEDHLRSGPTHQGPITLSRFHIELCQIGKRWIDGKRHRDAVVAPRGSGKSTWTFLILPTWALAHCHRMYVAAFADSGSQSQQHLISFKAETDTNDLLRGDFPGLVEPLRRGKGASVADRKDLYVSSANQVFQAKGIDASSLGAKVRNHRPDLLLFDDVEPDESNYSDYQKEQRQGTIVNAIFPMNLDAAVVFSGTVVMAGSIMHDMVRVRTEERPEDHDGDWPTWVDEEGISVWYYPALDWDDEGNPISIWPQKWSTDWMLGGEPVPTHRTASFQLNFQNSPRGRTDGWWTHETFTYGTLGAAATRWVLQIDPAVTDHKKSDYTGLVVGGFAPARARTPGRLEIVYADKVKLVGEALRRRVLKILNWYPQITAVFIESNVGGDMWRQTLHGLPVRVFTRYSSLPKQVRIAKALDWYERPGKRVVHTAQGALNKLELDMIAYPRIKHDDLVDAASLLVLRFLGTEQKRRVGVRSASYI